MQCFGSFTQSMLHRNLSHANQPMGGVKANPLSRQIQNEEKCSNSNQASTNSILILNIKKLVMGQNCNHFLYFHAGRQRLINKWLYVVVKWEKTVEFIAFTLLTKYLLLSPSGMKMKLQKDTVKILKGKFENYALFKAPQFSCQSLSAKRWKIISGDLFFIWSSTSQCIGRLRVFHFTPFFKAARERGITTLISKNWVVPYSNRGEFPIW